MASTLKIETADGRSSFVPGELLEAAAEWQLDSHVEAVEVRLIWYTHGEGEQDMDIVDSVRIESPELSGRRRWATRLPIGPYSFVGELFSLVWALELLVEPTGDTHRLEIAVAPHRSTILLYPESEDVPN